jgi:hypothetical protein
MILDSLRNKKQDRDVKIVPVAQLDRAVPS